ncbi:MAG: sulfatase [Rikenellaceae bacterium]
MNSNNLLLLLGVAAVASSCAESKSEADNGPMNILFIMCDDHSYKTISAYDKHLINTPNIDRIAENGVRFVNSFVANSISGPSRACMLTGKHSHMNGYTDNVSAEFDGGQQTFPKLLQGTGYQTAVIGKWHLTSMPTGFDYWDILVGQGHYYNPDFIRNGEDIQREGYATNLTTDLAIDWLEAGRDKEKPFCLLLHHKAPHRTWMPDLQDLELYSDQEFELPDNFYDDYSGRQAAAEQEMSIAKDMDLIYDTKLIDKDGQIAPTPLMKVGSTLVDRMTTEQRRTWDAHYDKVVAEFKAANMSEEEITEWKYRQYMRDYLRTVTSLDRNIGRVLDYLEAQGLDKNTMVVYTSDQGFYIGEHGWFDKRFMYEESFRTPLLVSLPDGKRGDIEQLVQNIDYAPTFLELAGVEIPEDIQGCSMLPLLRDQSTQWRNSLYYHFYEYPSEHMVKRHYGVRTDRYKLIHFYNDIDAWELYDLEQDPTEMNNIYGAEGTAEITSELKQELGRLREQYQVPENDGVVVKQRNL